MKALAKMSASVFPCRRSSSARTVSRLLPARPSGSFTRPRPPRYRISLAHICPRVESRITGAAGTDESAETDSRYASVLMIGTKPLTKESTKLARYTWSAANQCVKAMAGRRGALGGQRRGLAQVLARHRDLVGEARLLLGRRQERLLDGQAHGLLDLDLLRLTARGGAGVR